ncbi:MAG: family 16 glycosylhydrolase [Saprospiraceae bacterium]|nr:family 16 glycosylhydrolase [Saprospiraceae bacterium]
MNQLQIKIITFLICLSSGIGAQNIEDDFEGNGNINTWGAIDGAINTNWPNPLPQGINSSGTVLQYSDYGGLWVNAYFDAEANLNIEAHPEFSFKIYVPSGSITGSQNNQVTLKLQNSKIVNSWQSQTLISKPIVLDEWQVVHFNFITDDYVNFNPNSPPPASRTDFDRVMIQVNGENNTDLVVAYIDDFFHANNTPVTAQDIYDQLIWSDEFNTDGALDQAKWFHQTLFPISNSWYNDEIQHYTNRLANSYVQGGKLHLVAKKETYTDQGVTKGYTSARLNAKFAFTYGRVECRAKLPSGVGTWPAIWMLGQNINENGAFWQTQGFGEVSWPACGELDIMEHWGDNQNLVTSAIHTPSTYAGGVLNVGGQVVPTASTEFHTYALEWSEDKLVFSIDGVVHYIYQPAVKNAQTWPFDAPQYLLFNVAILPNIDPGFTQSAMEVDYIRIYQKNSVSTGENETDASIRAYPIPAQDQITLELHKAINGRVLFEVYDTHGAFVSAQHLQVENGRAQLKGLGALQSGIYLITFEKDGVRGTVKFVK